MFNQLFIVVVLTISTGAEVWGFNGTGSTTPKNQIFTDDIESRNEDNWETSWWWNNSHTGDIYKNMTSSINTSAVGFILHTTEVGLFSNTTEAGLPLNVRSRPCTLPSAGWSQLYQEYMMYILVAVGFFGNTVSLIVMLRSSRRTKASRLYLIALAITDNLVLLIFVLKSHTHTNSASCISINYCRRVFQSFSAYIVVIISIQRFIMVKFPFQASKHDSTAHGVFHLVTAFIFAVTSSLYQALVTQIKTSGPWKGCCRTTVRVDVFIYAHLSLHVFCAEIASSILVLVLTGITIHGVLTSAKKRAKLSSKSNDQELQQKKPKASADTKLTQMLIVLALVFVLVRMPYTICYWYDYLMWFIYWRETGRPASVATYTRNMRSTINVLLTLFMANYATNFIIYLVLWPSFRKSVLKLFGCYKCRKEKEISSNSGTTGSTSNTAI